MQGLFLLFCLTHHQGSESMPSFLYLNLHPLVFIRDVLSCMLSRLGGKKWGDNQRVLNQERELLLFCWPWKTRKPLSRQMIDGGEMEMWWKEKVGLCWWRRGRALQRRSHPLDKKTEECSSKTDLSVQIDYIYTILYPLDKKTEECSCLKSERALVYVCIHYLIHSYMYILTHTYTYVFLLSFFSVCQIIQDPNSTIVSFSFVWSV